MLLYEITNDFIKSLKPFIEESLEGSNLTIVITKDSFSVRASIGKIRRPSIETPQSCEEAINLLTNGYISMLHMLSADLPVTIILKIKNGKLIASNPFKPKVQKVEIDWFITFTASECTSEEFKPLMEVLQKEYLQSRN